MWSALLHLLGPVPSFASTDNDATIVHNNFGGVGMIDMPSARMAPDSELFAGASFFQNTQHYNFGFQFLPWLEASFRYSGLQHFDSLFPVYYDRSFALKARIFQETSITPALAVGINDLVGTGIYAGEYVVASKTFGHFDTTVGVGWGRTGSTALFRNPLASLAPSFENRRLGGDAGGANFSAFFHGPSGLFGGVVWHTPIEKLSLMAEYSSDTYAAEANRGNFRPRSQLNFGASYEVAPNIQVGLDWLYGRSFGGNIIFQLDPARPQYPAKLGPPPPQIATRSSDEQQQAIQTLLYERRGTPSSLKRASSARATFVDALWQQNGVSDVELNGSSLVLTVSSSAEPHCIAAARLAQLGDSTIKNILVRSANDRRPVQCVTASAREPAYQAFPATYPYSVIVASQFDETSVKTIDAIGADTRGAILAIRADARRQQIGIEAISLTGSTGTLYYSNFHYFAEADALDRLTRILMKDAPPNIEKFRLIAVSNGVPIQEFDILRGPEDRKFEQTGNLDLFGDTSGTVITPPPMQNAVFAAAERASYPRFSWSIFPQLRQELFDPDNPFAVQLAVGLEGSVQLLPGLSFNGEVETSLFDNFNNRRAASSALPHVRSDFLNYFDQGKTGIGSLDARYHFRLASNIFATAKIGYLESMFAGGGGEILWRPEAQRWALGVDGYEVWQRGFDRLLDLQKYHVFTGHVSLYYASPWHNLNFILSAGQYLAGDRGLTFQMTRRFSTGVEIGAFFTKTNISSERFGEGSFDKGIIIRIPLGWALPIETQGQWGINLRPVQRDGGQRLDGDTSLFDETQRSSLGEVVLQQSQLRSAQ